MKNGSFLVLSRILIGARTLPMRSQISAESDSQREISSPRAGAIRHKGRIIEAVLYCGGAHYRHCGAAMEWGAGNPVEIIRLKRGRAAVTMLGLHAFRRQLWRHEGMEHRADVWSAASRRY